MGIKCTPDFAQAAMENMLRGIDNADVYIDDADAFSDDWKINIKLLDEFLHRIVREWHHY